MGKPGADVNAGRAKLFEAVASHLDRIGRGAAELYAEAVHRECLERSRTERAGDEDGQSRVASPDDLAPARGLPRPRARLDSWRPSCGKITRGTRRTRPGSRRTSSTPSRRCTTRARALRTTVRTSRVARARAGGGRARGRPRAKPTDVKRAPREAWLLEKSPPPRRESEKESGGTAQALAAEALDGIGSALDALVRNGGGGGGGAAPSTRNLRSSTASRAGDSAKTALGSLALPGRASARTSSRRRCVLTRRRRLSAPGVDGRRERVLRRAVGVSDERERVVGRWRHLRDGCVFWTRSRRRWRTTRARQLVETRGDVVGAFAAGDGADRREGRPVEGAHRGAQGDGKARARGDRDRVSGVERSRRDDGARRAVDHGGGVVRARRRTSVRQAVRGDGQARALLGTYADLISLRPPGEPVQPSTLDLLIDIIRWVWEHYPFAGDRMRVSLHACLKNLFAALHERGGAALLADVHARLARPLLALSLRVAPPDPIDSALFDAQPVPLWPKYVGLWVDLLGGDRSRSRGRAPPSRTTPRDSKKKAPRDLVGEASSTLRRSRSRSIEMERGETERSSANRSSLDHSPMDVDAPSSDEASARAFPFRLSRSVRPALRGRGSTAVSDVEPGGGASAPRSRGWGGGGGGGFGGSRRGRGRDDARSGSGARRGRRGGGPGGRADVFEPGGFDVRGARGKRRIGRHPCGSRRSSSTSRRSRARTH